MTTKRIFNVILYMTFILAGFNSSVTANHVANHVADEEISDSDRLTKLPMESISTSDGNTKTVVAHRMTEASFTLQELAPFPPRDVFNHPLAANISANREQIAMTSPFSVLQTPVGFLNASPLARISIPCTKDCGDICEVCVPTPPFGEQCAPEPVCYANCQTERTNCWVLIDHYKGYMSGYIQNGRRYYGLSAQVKNALAPYIEQAIGKSRTELDEITVGTSGTVGEDNAMTDCNQISWINSAQGNSIVDALRGRYRSDADVLVGIKGNGDVDWVYHEFIHTFQCDELGGRTEYAYNWFSELPPATIGALKSGNYKNLDNEIHDRQPSEQDADNRRDMILNVMPVIVPRYVTSIKRLGAQRSGTTVTFSATANNVVSRDTIPNIILKDSARFLVFDENNNAVKTIAATPSSVQTSIKQAKPGDELYLDHGEFSGSWTIPTQFEGRILKYKFQILDNNDYLMDESSLRSLSIVKGYVYADPNKCTAGNEKGTPSEHYCTIQAALGDPDITHASIRIAAGKYRKLSINQKVVLESNGGVVQIGELPPTATPKPGTPTATPVPSTPTPIPPTSTSVPSTSTPIPPTLSLSTTALNLTVDSSSSNPTDQTLSINNSGTGMLNWTASESIDWLSLSETSGTAPSTIRIIIDSGGLVADDYTGEIQINAGSQTETITVHLKVEPSPAGEDGTIYLPLIKR